MNAQSEALQGPARPKLKDVEASWNRREKDRLPLGPGKAGLYMRRHILLRQVR